MKRNGSREPEPWRTEPAITADELAERFERAHKLALSLYSLTYELSEAPAGVFTLNESRELERANTGAAAALSVLSSFAARWRFPAGYGQESEAPRSPAELADEIEEIGAEILADLEADETSR